MKQRCRKFLLFDRLATWIIIGQLRSIIYLGELEVETCISAPYLMKRCRKLRCHDILFWQHALIRCSPMQHLRKTYEAFIVLLLLHSNFFVCLRCRSMFLNPYLIFSSYGGTICFICFAFIFLLLTLRIVCGSGRDNGVLQFSSYSERPPWCDKLLIGVGQGRVVPIVILSYLACHPLLAAKMNVPQQKMKWVHNYFSHFISLW